MRSTVGYPVPEVCKREGANKRCLTRGKRPSVIGQAPRRIKTFRPDLCSQHVRTMARTPAGSSHRFKATSIPSMSVGLGDWRLLVFNSWPLLSIKAASPSSHSLQQPSSISPFEHSNLLALAEAEVAPNSSIRRHVFPVVDDRPGHGRVRFYRITRRQSIAEEGLYSSNHGAVHVESGST